MVHMVTDQLNAIWKHFIKLRRQLGLAECVLPHDRKGELFLGDCWIMDGSLSGASETIL